MSLVHDHLGNAIQGVPANGDMAAPDRLLEVAASLYAHDPSSGSPLQLWTARNLGVGANGARFGAVLPMRSNGSTFDPELGNTQGTLLTSAARTVATSSADQVNYNARGVFLVLDVTAASGTGGLTPRLQAKDPVTGAYVTLHVDPAAAVTAVGTYGFSFYPGAAGSTNPASGRVHDAYQVALPRTWRLQVAVGDASSYQYSAGYALIN